MQISSLRIDRFGAWSDLRLSAFSDGLNVIYGPNGSGKTTVVQFIRAMLYGFDDGVRERYIPADSRVTGGELVVRGRTGKQTICRYDVGDRYGRLTIDHEDGSHLSRPDLQHLLGDVSSTTFDRLYLVGFQGGNEIQPLLDEALSQGFDLLGTVSDPHRLCELRDRLQIERRRLAELPGRDTPLADLLERRQRLQAEVESTRKSLLGQREEAACRLGGLATEIAELEEQIDKLQSDVNVVETETAAREQEKRRLEESLQAAQLQREAELAERREKLRTIDVQLERWREVVRDVETRIQRLAEDSGAVETDGGLPQGDPRYYLRRLEDRVQELQQSVARLDRSAEAAICQCRHLCETLGDSLRCLREDIYRLCNELSHWETTAHRIETSTELGQLRRCESELRQSIHGLTLRREQLAAELVSLETGRSAVVASPHGRLCTCTAHPLQVAAPPKVTEPDRVAETEAELRRLGRRREVLRDDLAAVQDELGDLRDERRRVQSQLGSDADTCRLDSRQSELDQLAEQIRDAERRQQLVAAIASVEAEIRLLEGTVRESTVLREASEMLRRLTGGELQHLHLNPTRSLSVQNRVGERLAYEQLSSGGRDQVYLSLCLALVTAYGRRGTYLPLILSDAFLNLDSQGAEAAALLLREFGQRGHQVLLFTRHAHVAALFRTLGLAVRELPSHNGPLPVVDVEAQRLLAINRELNAIAAESSQPSEAIVPRISSSEEFPGELTDRVRLRKAPEPAPVVVAADDSASEYFLWETSPIQDAPSVDSATAERLRKIGVLQVRDLLRLNADEAAEQLRYAGITAPMIRRWQAEALLTCRVARLRPYDARILVACSITDPDQLAGLEAAELLRRVEAFSTTSTGQVLLRAGNRYELSRLTDWIRTARRLRPGWQRHRPTAGARASGSDRERQRTPRPDDARDRTPRPDRETYGRAHRELPPRETRPVTPAAEGAPVVLKMDSAATNWRFYLDTTDAIEDAPSIGPRMAERLYATGIKTVADFLRADAADLATRLNNRRITVETIRQWQQQTILACRIPELRGHDAQILVACGVTDPETLAKIDPAELWKKVEPFVASIEGKRIIRNGKAPDFEEVYDWIRWSAHARALRAA